MASHDRFQPKPVNQSDLGSQIYRYVILFRYLKTMLAIVSVHSYACGLALSS